MHIPYVVRVLAAINFDHEIGFSAGEVSEIGAGIWRMNL
jgi:hypothetical protein